MRITRQLTTEALVKRINRVLRKDLRQLRRTRGERAWHDLGEYWVHDHNSNTIVCSHVDLHELGRELGVLPMTETNNK